MGPPKKPTGYADSRNSHRAECCSAVSRLREGRPYACWRNCLLADCGLRCRLHRLRGCQSHVGQVAALQCSFMGRFARTEMHRLGPCLTALRILARSNGLHCTILIEKHIDEYLRTDPFSLAHALERLHGAI